MTDWRMRLRDADRALASEVEAGTAHRLRRTVVASARATARRPLVWSRPFVAAAATLALVCVALITTAYEARVVYGTAATATGTESGDPALAAATDGAPPTDRQQLQFSTPGGTRIIWVFDPGFEVKGTLP